MASISLNLDIRGEKPTGSVRIRISHNGTSSFVNTGVKVEPEHFDPSNMRQPISCKAISFKEKNAQITNYIRKYDDTMMRLTMDESIHIDELTATDIRTYIIGERVCTRVRAHKQTRGGSQDFSTWFDSYAMSKKARACSDMQYVGRLLTEYCQTEGMDRLWFDDITYERLRDIEAYLERTGRKDATRVKVMSYIRSAYNEAERMEMIEYGRSPFRFYKIKPVPVSDQIQTVSVEGIRKLSHLMLTDGSELARARDMLLLSFLLCGPNLIDMYHMPVSEGDEVVYLRHKVEGRCARKTHIYKEPEIAMLLDMYHGSNHLLNLQDRYPNYKTFQRNFNYSCDELSTMVGEKVNMERIRRSWATIAGELDVPDRVIDKSMGHVDSGVKNKHYEDYKWNRTRQHNRRVMDYVLYGA